VRIALSSVAKIPLGVWIEWVDEDEVPEGYIPELQLRLRSSLGLLGLIMPNGIGTIDPDYREEIQLVLFNASGTTQFIKAGDRVAQLVQVLTCRIEEVPTSAEKRTGGFGSTSKEDS